MSEREREKGRKRKGNRETKIERQAYLVPVLVVGDDRERWGEDFVGFGAMR